ncbi:MAG TPA: ORF6N domain-containing protein [Bacteriovoracaceae bacterium]|nr:ORF6N domain-containing protein [Bacteriovoracaceae bacterium]
MEFKLEAIEDKIFLIRGQKVMIDSDLASLYGIETKRLNEQVRRNLDRFPEDFMFQLTTVEYEFLKTQIASSKEGRGGKQKLPLVFTENGVAMLSSVLNSKNAIRVNIAIMRIFTRLRSFHMLEKDVSRQIGEIKNDTNKMFKIVFERLDDLDTEKLALPVKRRKIGLKQSKE